MRQLNDIQAFWVSFRRKICYLLLTYALTRGVILLWQLVLHLPFRWHICVWVHRRWGHVAHVACCRDRVFLADVADRSLLAWVYPRRLLTAGQVSYTDSAAWTLAQADLHNAAGISWKISVSLLACCAIGASHSIVLVELQSTDGDLFRILRLGGWPKWWSASHFICIGCTTCSVIYIIHSNLCVLSSSLDRYKHGTINFIFNNW